MTLIEKLIIFGPIVITILLGIVEILDRIYCCVYKIKRNNTPTQDGNYD